MIVTAPGRELYRGCGRLRQRQDIMKYVLLGIVLAVLTVLLWLLRRNTMELLIGGGLLAVAFFYIYFILLKHTDSVIRFVEKCCRPFDRAFGRHAHAVYGKRQTGKTAASADRSRHSHQSRAQRKKAQEQRRNNSTQQRNKGAAGEFGQQNRQNTAGARGQRGDKRQYEQTEQRRKADSGQAGRTGDGAAGKRSERANHAGGAEFEEAQLIYAVRIPYTTDEIKQKRNILLKKYHPDNADGSEEMCKKINECYRILRKYAS